MNHPLTLGAGDVGQILLWAGVLIVVAMVGGVVMMAVRRSMLSDTPGSGDGGLLDQMRRMVSDGRMTQEEFDQARRKMAERAKASGTRPADPSERA